MSGFSTVGRRRLLTQRQIEEILEWARTKLTNAQMARKYGINRSTLETIIRTTGKHYKQAAPI